jgi:hypothetical protein
MAKFVCRNAQPCGCLGLLLALASAALALLSEQSGPLVAQTRNSIRSTNDGLRRTDVRLDQPLWREGQSHRGWEIRTAQYTVFANTSLDDARWAEAQVEQAWSNAQRLADRWTDNHRQPGFGQGATQITIDSEPLRERDGPLTTLNVVGIQTQVYLNVSPGQPTLKQQALRLREATAFAMLHTAGLDAAVPPWVAQGLAANIAEQGLDASELAAAKEVKLPGRLGGEQWRYTRSGQDLLDYPQLDLEGAAAQVKFLLEGDDARHAPAFLAAVRAAWSEAKDTAAAGAQFRNQPRSPQPPPTDTAFDRLLADLQPQFKAWQKDPLAGQPVFEADAKLAPEVLAAEREMLVVLKLSRKLALASAGSGPRPRVTTFDRNLGRQVVVSAARPAPPASFEQLVQRLSDSSAQPVATLDADGSLLVSTDTVRREALLGRPGEYSFARRGDQIVLVRQLAGGLALQGWLENNPAQPTRPLAKFEVASARPQAKSSSAPVVREARRAAAE